MPHVDTDNRTAADIHDYNESALHALRRRILELENENLNLIQENYRLRQQRHDGHIGAVEA